MEGLPPLFPFVTKSQGRIGPSVNSVLCEFALELLLMFHMQVRKRTELSMYNFTGSIL
jgi:hypothetical protein